MASIAFQTNRFPVWSYVLYAFQNILQKKVRPRHQSTMGLWRRGVKGLCSVPEQFRVPCALNRIQAPLGNSGLWL